MRRGCAPRFRAKLHQCLWVCNVSVGCDCAVMKKLPPTHFKVCSGKQLWEHSGGAAWAKEPRGSKGTQDGGGGNSFSDSTSQRDNKLGDAGTRVAHDSAGTTVSTRRSFLPTKPCALEEDRGPESVSEAHADVLVNQADRRLDWWL